MKTFVIGDIHGNYKALMQCLDKSNFSHKKDQLICLGDVADGYPDVTKCFEELLKMNNLVYVLGNHDSWLIDWLKDEKRPHIWVSQGGANSIASYISSPLELRAKHLEFLKAKAKLHYTDDSNRFFVHGGYNPNIPISDNLTDTFLWDRDIIDYAVANKVSGKEFDYKEVFIGHTTTEYRFASMKPQHISNLWMLDTGAGWSGKLTIMNVETKEYWQSDKASDLYNINPRR